MVVQANAAPGGASYQSLFDAWSPGNRMLEAAEVAAKKKHTVTDATGTSAPRSTTTRRCIWVLGTSTPDREAEVYLAMNDALHESAKRRPRRGSR